MKFEVQLPDVSDARFRRDIGVGRLNAAVALLAGITVFCLTLTFGGREGVLAFGASYAVIPAMLALGMLLERNFLLAKLIQASIVIALIKFVITMIIHLIYKRVLAA